jgi:acetyl-CoA acetyltransferase
MKSLILSEATLLSGAKAFAMVGVGHKDFNHLMFYDAFISGPPIMLESLGFCKSGEGVHSFDSRKAAPGGSLPINTKRGGLSYTHSGMYGIFPITEATRQLRGECGPRQVPNYKVPLVDGMGGMLSASGTLMLSSEK